MRIGESLALKWPDVDFKRGSIKISKTLYYPVNNKVKYTLLTPKTKGSMRTIKMDDQVMKLFKNHLLKQIEIKIQNRHHYKDENFVFTFTRGLSFSAKTGCNTFNNVFLRSYLLSTRKLRCIRSAYSHCVTDR
ncbi:hypothetical protein [Bacillus sp. UMB0893]|uniref:hypothetical protein n=1 Tax=Bacillus sp. UMB0893 TaxID=2066053 RepID=UPI0035B503E6